MEIDFEVGDGAIINNEVIGHCDWSTFFHVFNLAVIAFADGLVVKGAIRAFGDAFVTEFFGNNNGN